MTTTYKTLAQLNPAATTLTTLYTVPAATSTVVSTITVANNSATDATFRLSVAVAAAADNAKQYIAYGVTCPGNGMYSFTIGMTLAATDLIRAYASTTTLSFNVFGSEIS
jgi:hypothetical protein